MDYNCTICGEPLPDYKPEYCCNGVDCGCMGLPINPPWCDKCWDKIMKEKTEDGKDNGIESSLV